MIKHKKNIDFFTSSLMNWHFQDNKRQMPWKGEKDPYKIWLSEVILQQTRVEQGQAYYERFVQKYQSVKHLAAASEDEVFKMWEGLGYYSRCKNLLFTARKIVAENKGVFPSTYKEIISLKGVGPYIASAIASFAFNLPYAVLDGNVFRVLSRFFGIITAIDSSDGKKQFAELANQCLDTNAPGNYNQAIMDFGASVCTPFNPSCNKCYLKDKCEAFSRNIIDKLPVKEKSIQKKKRWLTYFIIQNGNNILIRKRAGRDIWENLHEFYLVETEKQKQWTKAQINNFAYNNLGIKAQIIHQSDIYSQTLTHQFINARFILLNAEGQIKPIKDYFWKEKKQLKKIAFPKIINSYLDKYNYQ